MTVTEITAAGAAFDMDGTLIDSKDAFEQHWRRYARSINVSPDQVLATSHGRRTIDTLAEINPQEATWEHVHALESSIPIDFGAGALPIPGAKAILASFRSSQVPWSIVTSGSTALVHSWLEVLQMPAPPVLVASDNVEVGKPDPEGYLKAMRGMGLREGEAWVVFEDAPAGVVAGKKAGATVIGLATTYEASVVREAGADIVVKDLSFVEMVSRAQGEVVLRVDTSMI